MNYISAFIEGLISFISPCLLPMLPIYISYFAGGEEPNAYTKSKAFTNSIGFVIGFTIVFLLMGVTAGSFGIFIKNNQTVFDLIGGALIVFLGLNYIGYIKLNFLNKTFKLNKKFTGNNIFTSILFGLVFSIGWSPCIGPFLGSALLFAANSQSSLEGILMLLSYSLGLGIPFLLSALFLENLKLAFGFIKRNYKVINLVSGLFLIFVGLFMMFGKLKYFLFLFY